MKTGIWARVGGIQRRQWSALGLAVGLGGLLVAVAFAVLFAGLAPRAALAAGPAEPAVIYPCSQAGLNAALAAGGSATFSCAVPTTVTVSSRKLVTKSVSLDGGDRLILSGGNTTGVFSVPIGVKLTLLNLTLRDAHDLSYGGDIVNWGQLVVTHTQFISNAAGAAAALFNAPGASAVISNSLFRENVGEAGAILNGFSSPVKPATLVVLSSTFILNEAATGGGIYNFNGPLTVTHSSFGFNVAYNGGAIYAASNTWVNDSIFVINGGVPLASQAAPAHLHLQAPAGTGGYGGGAIFAPGSGNVIIASSYFTFNYGLQGGGALVYGSLPLVAAAGNAADSGLTAPAAPPTLSITGSHFDNNCTGGAGGAFVNSLPASIQDSSFSANGAYSDGCGFLAQQAAAQAHLAAALNAPAGAPLSGAPAGSGGAIYNSAALLVQNTTFLTNSATVTGTGGGGAIANATGANLQIDGSHFTANTAWQDGGAIFNDFSAAASVAGSDFTRNRVITDSGGAVANLGVFTATYSTFTENGGAPHIGSLMFGGGAIFSIGAPIVAGPSRPNGPGGSQPALALGARVAIDHSTFLSNFSEFEGGALDVGAGSVVASSFSGNYARYGGAVDVLDIGLTISGSTFSGNTVVTTTEGGPVEGGALDANGLAVTILNSTFFNNQASGASHGGALNGDGAALTLVNSTVISNVAPAGQGGAYADNASFVLTNTLTAYNLGGACQAGMALSASNLEYPGATCGGSALHSDPLALAPADNGGPTLTSALRPGSPAINAGNDSGCPTTDQRGAHRPAGPHCDIGAFEFDGLVPRLWLPLARK